MGYSSDWIHALRSQERISFLRDVRSFFENRRSSLPVANKKR